MEFKDKGNFKVAGIIIAVIFMYFVFTTVLYFILKFTHRLPASWSYISLSIVTTFVILSGSLIKLLLK